MIEFLHLLISVVVLAIILNGDCVTSILTDYGYTCSGGPNSSIRMRIEYPFYSEYTNTYAYPVLLRNHSLLNTTYVGYPGFLVNCEDDGRLTSNLSTTNLYYLQDIEYFTRTFTAVDVSVSRQECPQPRHNFSGKSNFYNLDNYTEDIEYSNNDFVFVRMFYNCSSGYPEHTVQHLPCLDDSYNNKTKMNTTSRGGRGGRSFAFLEEKIPQGFNWSQNCKENVRVPVRNNWIMESDYGQALRAAFRLRFQLNFDVPFTEECSYCEYSGRDEGGYCVHSKQTNAFVGCICSYGTKFVRNGVCRKDGVIPQRAYNAEEGECLGLLRAVQWLLPLPFGTPDSQVIIESDSLSAVLHLTGKATTLSRASQSILADLSFITMHRSFTFVHVARTGNFVAHTLAKKAQILSESSWTGSPPDWLLSSLAVDRHFCNMQLVRD